MENKLIKYLRQTKILDPFEIKLIKEGHNQSVFKIEGDENTFVAHVGKKKRDSGSSLYNSYRILTYLESKKINFVPEVVSYDEEANILIETFVGNEEGEFSKISDEQINIFVRQLATIHSFSAPAVIDYCKENGFTAPEIQTPTKNIEIFGSGRFDIVKKTCPDASIIKWIEPKLKENIKKAKSLTFKNKPGLRWGDIGNNIRITKNYVYFIDWEFSSLFYEHELAYIKIHSHPTVEQFELIVENYSQHSGIELRKLYDEILLEEKNIRIGDVIWAAMKWGENIADEAEAKKYEALTHKRIGLYEAFINESKV